MEPAKQGHRHKPKRLNIRLPISQLALQFVIFSKISRIYRVYKYGDNTEPCLVSMLMLNDSDKVLFHSPELFDGNTIMTVVSILYGI